MSRRARVLTLASAACAVAVITVYSLAHRHGRATVPRPSATTKTENDLASRAQRAAAMAKLRVQLGTTATVGALRSALEQCALTDPRLALELAASWARNRNEHYRLAWAVVARWAPTAPRDAWNWARANERLITVEGEPMLATACLQAVAAGSEPQRVLAWLLDGVDAAPTSSERAALVDAGISALVGAGRVDLARVTIERCVNHDANSVTAVALTNVTLAVLRQTSAEAAAVWLQQLPSSTARGAAAVALVAEWAERQPESALEWTSTLPAGELRQSALSHALGAWAGRDASAAANWFLQNEQTGDADRLIPALIEQSRLAYTNPVTAIRWADLVRDPLLRTRSFTAVAQQWAEQDRAAAVRFVSDSPLLNSQQRAAILAALGG
jgi:hypothetical protein